MAEPGRASRRRAEPHISDQAPPVWRAPEGPEGLAAVPVGGGRARAGLEIDHSEPQARVWRSRGRPGPTAPGTPAEPQATSSIANYGCTAGVKGARGPGRGARGRRGLAAVPEGGGRARAGLEIDHSERSSRVAISRAGRRPPAHTAAGPHKAAQDRCAA